MCVETIDYFVIVTNDVVGPIIPSQWQGNPLSPYLLYVHKASQRLLDKLKGQRICNDAHVISHLLFADDCFLFIFSVRKKEKLK